MKTGDEEPIVVSQVFAASVEEVWEAITDQNKMIKWFFAEISTFRPEVGFETHFTVKSGGREFEHIWKATQATKPKLISYGWRYEGYPGDSEVIWEISLEKDQTKVTLTHKGGESFPQNIPEFRRKICSEGWDYFIRQSLKKYLDKI